MVCACIASAGWAREADRIASLCQNNKTNGSLVTLVGCPQNSTGDFYAFLPANTVKLAAIAGLPACLSIILIFYLGHVFVAWRKQRKWKLVTRIIAGIFFLLFLVISVISAAAVVWEMKLIAIFGTRYLSNSYQLTPTGYRKAQTGAASGVAVFSFLSALLLLIDIICRLLTIGSVQKRQRRRKRRVNVIS